MPNPLADRFATLQAPLDALNTVKMAVSYDPESDPWQAPDPALFMEPEDDEAPEPKYFALEAAWADVWAIVQQLEAAGHVARYEQDDAEPDALEGLSFAGTYACAIVFGEHDFTHWTHKVRGDAHGGSSSCSLFHYPDKPDLPEMFRQRMGFERTDGFFPCDYDQACRWAGIDDDEEEAMTTPDVRASRRIPAPPFHYSHQEPRHAPQESL